MKKYQQLYFLITFLFVSLLLFLWLTNIDTLSLFVEQNNNLGKNNIKIENAINDLLIKYKEDIDFEVTNNLPIENNYFIYNSIVNDKKILIKINETNIIKKPSLENMIYSKNITFTDDKRNIEFTVLFEKNLETNIIEYSIVKKIYN